MIRHPTPIRQHRTPQRMNASPLRRRVALPAALVLSLAGGAARASEELAVKYACVACHEIDFRKVGPSFEDVARKYRGADEQAVDTLVNHVREGSTGIWGKDIMPAQPLVPAADAKVLVLWVLSLGR